MGCRRYIPVPPPRRARRKNYLDAFAAEDRAIARAVMAELPDWSIAYFDEAEAARAKYQGAPADYEIEIP